MTQRSCSLAVILWCTLLPLGATAQPKVEAQASATHKIHMEVGETRLVRLTEKIIRVSIAEPSVADVRVVTPLQVLVTGKSVGYTHLVLWSEADNPLVMEVVCQRNLADLRGQLKELFPKEQIKVSSAGDLVVLSGEVSDLRVPSRLAQVAKLHSEKLANLVQVSGDQQVQLEVRFAEVSRSGLRKMGVNFLWRDSERGYIGNLTAAGTTAGSFLDRPKQAFIPGTGETGPPFVGAPVAGDAFQLIFSTGLSSFPFSAILSILAQQGLAKVLAEPTLVAMSGQEASFHAGGEVPILIAQQLGTVSVTFKKFGVRLKFVPTVLGERTINLKLFAEVSEPDASTSVSMQGFQVPGFRTRNSETTVRLKDGQSFAVAGLLSDNVRSTVKKVPLFGEIPILGALFRSTSFQREESELLVVVKAHLTQPVQLEEPMPMPGDDEVTHPSDFNFFLLGDIGGEKKKKEEREEKKETAGGPVGPVGFMRD
jgi:pilus assembly protein CpaC